MSMEFYVEWSGFHVKHAAGSGIYSTWNIPYQFSYCQAEPVEACLS